MKRSFSGDEFLNTNLNFNEYFNDSIDFRWKNKFVEYCLSKAEVSLTVQEFFFQTLVEKMTAVSLILASSPIFLIIMVINATTSKGGVFYTQTRVGKNGKHFKIIKFRSMVLGAEKSTGHVLSWDGDPRITRFGNFLRKSHLDELPQLINVLLGDMSFIGPRPERPEFTNEYSETIAKYNDRHIIKPGITGLAQIALVYDATAEEKLKFDLLYITYKNSIYVNSFIALLTIKKMLFLSKTAKILG